MIEGELALEGTLPIGEVQLDAHQEYEDQEPEIGIIKRCEGTFTTKIHLPNGKELYLAMEKLDTNPKWDIYKETSRRLSTYLAEAAQGLGCSENLMRQFYKGGLFGDISIEELEEKILHMREKFGDHKIFSKDRGFSDADFKPGFQDWIGLEGEAFDNFVNMFKNALKERPKVESMLSGVQGGTVSFRSDWITYASNEPIVGKLQVKSDPLPAGRFKLLAEDFGSVIISVGTAEYPDLPVYQNRSIFKNPYWIIKGGYDHLSMVLHSFTGRVAQEFWQDKIYLTIAPLPGMQKIILEFFEKEELFIGDNKHKPYPDFPPLAHEFKLGLSESVFKIAKEGVDTSKYPDSELPDELTQFTQIVDYRHSSPILKPNIEGLGDSKEHPNYIKISALVRLFESYCVKDIP